MTIDTTDLGMRKHSVILLALAFFLPFSTAVSVGASPGFIDVGEIEPGTTQEIDFYITTNMDEEFQVSPEYRKTTKFLGYSGIEMENISEQDVSSWIDFTEESYTIDPSSSETYELPEGTSVNAEGVVTMEINIPPNPEPGYRMGELELNPSISGDGSGAGARVVGQTVPGFAFSTPGVVERDMEVGNIRGIRIGENEVQIIGRIGNTGTVTTAFEGAEVDVLNEGNQKIGSVRFDSATLEPGEYADIEAIWDSESVEGGEYAIEGTGSYSTGETYISGDFVITSAVQERESVDEPSGGTAEEPGSETPVTMIIVLAMLLGVLLYVLEIDLMWIAMIIGGTAVSMFILFGTASNYLVLIPLMSIALMLYV